MPPENHLLSDCAFLSASMLRLGNSIPWTELKLKLDCMPLTVFVPFPNNLCGLLSSLVRSAAAPVRWPPLVFALGSFARVLLSMVGALIELDDPIIPIPSVSSPYPTSASS